jgi:hypothetical protein
MINSIGPVTIEVMKSQISFGTRIKFGWVWLPQPWSNKRPENSIVLTFGVGRHIENEQIVEVVEPYPGRWTHHVIIQNESDLNDDVYQWLCEAYSFSGKRERKSVPDAEEKKRIDKVR